MNNISIIGIGRLGLCAALVFEKAGFNVLGVDINERYVKSINEKTLVSPEPFVTDYLKSSTNFRATMSLDDALAHSDLIFILVATPTGVASKSYDHSALSNVLCEIDKRKVHGKHIVIGCTVLPGYTAKTGRYLLRNCTETTLNYNPEFIAQGDIIRGFEFPDIVLLGVENSVVSDLLTELYTKCCKNEPKFCKMSVESAEITKLGLNCFITTKIAFANTIADIAYRTPHADPHDILQAIGSDSRVGQKCLKPGYGFGGPCFPRDNRALGNYAESIGVEPIIPRATDESNRLHTKLMAADFEAKLGIGNPYSYTFRDVAYKPGCAVPIIEESQKLAVAEILAKKGTPICISDRQDIITEVMKEYGSLFKYKVEKVEDLTNDHATNDHTTNDQK